jgi:nucleotide-binding universal stress UspA family protein
MGARGLGTVTGVLLGSVTQRVVHLTDLPVVVVK